MLEWCFQFERSQGQENTFSTKCEPWQRFELFAVPWRTQPHSQLSALIHGCFVISSDVPGKGLVYLDTKSASANSRQDKQQQVSTLSGPLAMGTNH